MKRSPVVALVVFVFLLTPYSIMYAEITSPYTVDFKDPVLFGDSTLVSGKNGLENYTSEYVGNYLHITFTYTHHTITFSSYPPKMYITAEDPRNTASPTVRKNLVLFQLLATTHPTDWYEYDIQFDATGYTVVVKQTGITEIYNAHESVAGQSNSDWAALANDYPVAPSSNFSMSFTPLPIYEAPAVSSSGSADETSVTRSRSGERARCVETVVGLYCPSEEVREFYIKHNMEMLIYLLEQLIQKYKEAYNV